MSETLVKIRQVEGLREELNDLGSAGVGGAVLQSHADANFSNGVPSTDRVAYASSNAGGWNLGAGRLTLSFDFFSTNYFAQNPGGHFAIVTRCPTSLLATDIRGQGMILGNVSGALNGSSVVPTAQIETFFSNLAAPGNRLLPDTGTYDPLVDNTTYRILLSTSIRSDGTQWIRYQLYKFDSGETAYDPIRDTGDILDNNPFIDLTQTGFAFLHVFENALASPWSVNITNVKTLWEAASQSNATGSPTIDLGGVSGPDYTLVGSELSIRSNTVPFTNNDPFRIRDFRANTGTQVSILPNGTATDTGIVCSNSSSWTTPWTYLKLGMSGSIGVIESFAGSGGSVAPIMVTIQGSEKWRWSQTFSESFNPLSFNSNASGIWFKSTPFLTDDSFTFMPNDTNAGANLTVKPNGTAVDAGYVAINKNTKTGAWSYVKLGINAGNAILETLGVSGGATPPIQFKPGGALVATFNASGLMFADNSIQSAAAGGIALRAYTTATPALTNGADNTVVFDTVGVNIGGGTFNTGTGIYTVPQTGTYKITAQVSFEAVGASITLIPIVAVRHNGSTSQSGQTASGEDTGTLNASNSRTVSVSAIFTCTAGDNIRCIAFPSFSGAGTCRISGTTGGFSTQLLIERI